MAQYAPLSVKKTINKYTNKIKTIIGLRDYATEQVAKRLVMQIDLLNIECITVYSFTDGH